MDQTEERERGTGVARMTPSHWPPVVAVLVTVLLGAVMHVTEAASEVALPFLGLLASVALLAPLGVPLLWSWALLKGPSLQRTALIALVGLGGLMALFPGEIGGLLVTYSVVGLLAAFGLLSRWHPGLLLGALCGVLIPLVVVSSDMATFDEIMTQQKEQVLQTRREMLKVGQDEGAEPPTLAVEAEALDHATATVRLLVPGGIAAGIILEATLNLWLIQLLAGRLRPRLSLRGLPPFGRWRLPFAVVWMLAAGIGLMVAPRYMAALADWLPVGPNLLLVLVTLVALQGAAVQWHLTPRGVPVLVRLVILFMAGFLFLPLLFLGLADQWLDFRKLDTDGPADRDDNGGNDDAPADKQGG